MNGYSYQNVIDFKNICRACMGIDNSNTKISDTIKFGKYTLEALKVMNLLCDVKLAKEYPDKICFNCLETVKDIFKFKLQVEKSESVLQKHLGPVKSLSPATFDTENNDHNFGTLKMTFLDLDKQSLVENAQALNLTQPKNEDYDFMTQSKMREKDDYLYENDLKMTFENDSSDTNSSHKLDNILQKYNVSQHPEKNLETKKNDLDPNEWPAESNTLENDKVQVKKLLPVTCPVCQKTLKTKYILQTHMKRHKLKGQFSCFHCGKRFSSQGCLKRHLTIHTGEKNFICQICDKRYPSVSNLKLHLKTHTDRKPYLCNLCEKSYANATGLNFHMKTHRNEKPFKCSVCEKAFIVQSHLDAHLKIHTGEKPFKCTYCEKAFIKKFDLKRHEAIHTGDKPFKCEFCEKSFIMKVHYQYHTRLHKNERPFVCHICSKAFIRRYYLKNHYMKIHHSLEGSVFQNK